MLVLSLVLALEVPGDLVAVGAVFARDAQRSVAILQAQGRTRVARVGETAFGARVAAVSATTVTLEVDGRRVELPFAGGGTVPSAQQPSPAKPPPATGPDEPAVVSFERREVERRLGQEIPRILAETSVVPVTEGGQVVGLALTRIPDGSLLTEAGLRAGDVLTQINGFVIDGVASLASLYAKLQNEKAVRAVVLRDGQPVTLALDFR